VDAGPLTPARCTRQRARSWGGALILVTVALALAGCTDDGGADAAIDSTTSSPDAPADSTTSTMVQPVGDPVTRYQLVVGDCFNRYESIDVITRVSCDSPHDAEMFHYETHPAPFGEPYPNDREMQQYALSVCYAQFESFAGVLYELSRLDIGVITPTKENFEDSKARYRGISCYVTDQDGEPLVGSMRGRGE
jgi:hypothetical protein